MKVVIELDVYSLKYENIITIARAFVAAGVEVSMWNSGMVPLLDMLHDIRPDVIFYHSEIIPRISEKIWKEYPSTRLVSTDGYDKLLIADTVSFKPMNPHPIFQGSEICILQYPEIEDTENVVLKNRMSVKNSYKFRLFSVKPVSGARFCGWIPKEMHPIIFSSASSVLALSKQTAINAFLCNKNVSIVENGVESQFAMEQEEINALSNVTIANSYMGD